MSASRCDWASCSPIRRTRWCGSRGRRGASSTASSTPTGSGSVGTSTVSPNRRGTAAAGPIWSDETFADLARVVRTGALLAAVRSATVGMAGGQAAAAPFRSGPWLFSHNGAVDGWPAVAGRLGWDLDPGALALLEAPTDSALLWAMTVDLLARGKTARGRARPRCSARAVAGRRRPADLPAHRRAPHHRNRLGHQPVLAPTARRGRRCLGALRRRPVLGGRPGPFAAGRGRDRRHRRRRLT